MAEKRSEGTLIRSGIVIKSIQRVSHAILILMSIHDEMIIKVCFFVCEQFNWRITARPFGESFGFICFGYVYICCSNSCVSTGRTTYIFIPYAPLHLLFLFNLESQFSGSRLRYWQYYYSFYALCVGRSGQKFGEYNFT